MSQSKPEDFTPPPTITVSNCSNQSWINTTLIRVEADGSITQRSTFTSKRG
jgi:hypothetical protein